MLTAAAAIGLGSALGVAACGEDREGDVQFEDGTGTAGTATAGTGTVETEEAGTEGTGTAETETGAGETETTP
jgi:hypothetical protein